MVSVPQTPENKDPFSNLLNRSLQDAADPLRTLSKISTENVARTETKLSIGNPLALDQKSSEKTIASLNVELENNQAKKGSEIKLNELIGTVSKDDDKAIASFLLPPPETNQEIEKVDNKPPQLVSSLMTADMLTP